jgi:hypothetical protein
MATKRGGNPKSLDELSKKIAGELKRRFIESGLNSRALSQGYNGVPISQLREFCDGGGASQVDFDLSLKQLEDGGFVTTGPLAAHENVPNSGVFILGFYSKREYACLTEAGYRVPTPNSGGEKVNRSSSQINISGGHFHGSQIALGAQITQQQNTETNHDAEVIMRLVELLAKSGTPVDQAAKEDVQAMVSAAKEGHLNEAKPIFQKLFGFAAETVKQTAWGILTALLAKAMGL